MLHSLGFHLKSFSALSIKHWPVGIFCWIQYPSSFCKDIAEKYRKHCRSTSLNHSVNELPLFSFFLKPKLNLFLESASIFHYNLKSHTRFDASPAALFIFVSSRGFTGMRMMIMHEIG